MSTFTKISILIILVLSATMAMGSPQKPLKASAGPSVQKTKKKARQKIKSKKPREPAQNQSPKYRKKPDTKIARKPAGMAGPGLMAGAMNANKALEIRGQARTLSMMLILRNGKENVNFVKVRDNYRTEISKTEF